MTKRVRPKLEHLERKLKKLEDEYEKTNENSTLKRSRIEKKATKIQNKIDIVKKSFYGGVA